MKWEKWFDLLFSSPNAMGEVRRGLRHFLKKTNQPSPNPSQAWEGKSLIKRLTYYNDSILNDQLFPSEIHLGYIDFCICL